MNYEFRDECVEWLEPLGYSIHSYNSQHTNYSFWNITNLDENYPFIKCWIEDGNKRCQVETMIPCSIFAMTCGPLSFKHPDIEKFINKMKHYLNVIEYFPYKS